MPKTRLRIATGSLSSGIVSTYSSYCFNNVGRWSIGNRGNHSCTNMFIIWSERSRGGDFRYSFESNAAGTGAETTGFNSLSALRAEQDLPLSCVLIAKASRAQSVHTVATTQ